jgi:hypothetical protein
MAFCNASGREHGGCRGVDSLQCTVTEKARAVFAATVVESTGSKKKKKKRRQLSAPEEIDITHSIAVNASCKPPKSRQPHSQLTTASQTCSTSPGADINEEPLIRSSIDPSNMHEVPAPTPMYIFVENFKDPRKQFQAHAQTARGLETR